MAALAVGSVACDVTDRILAPDKCTLALDVDTAQGREPVEPPYVVELSPRGTEPPTAISFQGNGWSLVDVMQFGPDGAVVDIYRGEGLMINQGMGCVHDRSARYMALSARRRQGWLLS